MCFAQSRYRVCCFLSVFSPKLLQPFCKDIYRCWTVTVSFSAVSNGLLVASTKEKKKLKNVALIENMKGDCLAYVAHCSFELATKIFQVYQQCKKTNKND